MDLIKVLETRVCEDQLEKMKLFSLMERSREDLVVRSRNFSFFLKRIFFILISLEDNNFLHMQKLGKLIGGLEN